MQLDELFPAKLVLGEVDLTYPLFREPQLVRCCRYLLARTCLVQDTEMHQDQNLGLVKGVESSWTNPFSMELLRRRKVAPDARNNVEVSVIIGSLRWISVLRKGGETLAFILNLKLSKSQHVIYTQQFN
jgi:hypothetical protein